MFSDCIRHYKLYAIIFISLVNLKIHLLLFRVWSHFICRILQPFCGLPKTIFNGMFLWGKVCVRRTLNEAALLHFHLILHSPPPQFPSRQASAITGTLPLFLSSPSYWSLISVPSSPLTSSPLSIRIPVGMRSGGTMAVFNGSTEEVVLGFCG